MSVVGGSDGLWQLMAPVGGKVKKLQNYFFSTFGEWVGGSEANVEFSKFFFDPFPNTASFYILVTILGDLPYWFPLRRNRVN